MKTYPIFFLSLGLCLLVAGPIWAQTMPDPAFDPGYIISDYDITNYNTMSVSQIQTFLERQGSALATFSCADNNGQNWTAAQSIYNIAQANKISPKFLLVLVQKEQGLVEDSSPKASQLDWATGYGCPDGGGCNDRWKGFWKQVNSASLQFKDYLENPQLYHYKQGETYTFSNPYSTTVKATVTVKMANQGTAALYNYTPHVYNGNYNFWKLWRRYFGTSVTQTYPNGSLLQAKGEAGVWLIQNGVRRAFLAKGALTSRFDINKVIQVDKAELKYFEIGTPIKFPQYSIVMSPDQKLYLLVDNTKRPFDSKEAFARLGYNVEEIMNASYEDLASYTTGTTITANDAYPTGALLQNKKTGGVYWVEGQTKSALTDAIYLKTKFKNKKIIKVAPETLDKYTTVSPVKFNDGELIKISNGMSVYVLEDGLLRPIVSMEVFNKLGYQAKNIITISPKVFLTYTVGDVLGQ